MFQNLLVANRGEIAVRVIRAARELGIRTIAVYSAAEPLSPHVLLADSAVCVGGAAAVDSYLNIDSIVAAALESGADAVHPGYGFLSENASFAARCAAAGLVFIGPSPEVIGVMGDKTTAREAARAAGVPMLPGSAGAVAEANLVAEAEQIGYPVVVKAAFGGGGRGMRVVQDSDRLPAAAQAAAREASNAFGRAEIFLERYLTDARHIEVQLLGDRYGTVVALGDRDCTVQRRHQKMLEEAPAPELPDRVRQALQSASVKLGESVGYEGAGTVEFLYSPATDEFFFLEMNTRLQVEHGVTELVTGIDLVHQQLRIAAGEPLTFSQADVQVSGHAVQARIAAEDPWAGFLPRTGAIGRFEPPNAPWIRSDFGIAAGGTIVSHYDSMIGKVMAWAPDRNLAADRLRLALGDLLIEGGTTTAPYLATILDLPDYRSMNYSTETVAERWDPADFPAPHAAEEAPAPAIPVVDPGPGTLRARPITLDTDKGPVVLTVWGRVAEAADAAVARSLGRRSAGRTAAGSASEPLAPMDATVISVEVRPGQVVEAGATLAVVEAMKMEMPVVAPRAGTVTELLVAVGDSVTTGQRIATITDP